MIDKNKLHLIPPLVVDRAEALEESKQPREACEIYAQQLEAIRDYCAEALSRYEKRKVKTWNKAS